MNAKYLIVKVFDNCEYDEKIPVKVCETFSAEEVDECEVYEIKENGEIGGLVKGIEDYSDCGFALVDWCCNDELEQVYFDNVKVIGKISCNSREEFIQTPEFKRWKKYVQDSEFIDNYEEEILCMGSFTEDYNENKKHWFVITEYYGKRLSLP